MPTKHAILSEMSADDLRYYVDDYGLEVSDRRVKAQLIDVLVGCEKASIEEILGDGKDWFRDDLKALCRRCGIDDSETRKADLVARLIASPEEQEVGATQRKETWPPNGQAPKKQAKATARPARNGATIGYEAELWAMADTLRGAMDASEYKHIALGLIFLKYISDAFEAKRTDLLNEELADAEDPEEYLAENVFWVPKAGRWSHLQAKAKQPTIGKNIDDAMLAIEASNASLKGVLPKDYARPALNKVMLGELIDLVSGIGMAEEADRSRDILGRVYEYFLGGFAGAEGKRGGEFYTPRTVVRLLVEMLEPYKGRVYDPCAAPGECSSNPRSSLRNMAAASATSPFTGRRATTPRGGLPR